MHFGNPLEAVIEVYEDILGIVSSDAIKAVAFTGSLSRIASEKTLCPFYFDTLSVSAGAEIIAPDCEYLIHVGAKDPYFFEREKNRQYYGQFFCFRPRNWN